MLVVDSDESVVGPLAQFLGERDVVVLTRKSGEGIVEFAAAERPDLILLDVRPDEDDLRHLEALKGRDDLREIPVLVMTVLPTEDACVRALTMGAADFLHKPLNVRELLARVQTRLHDARELRRVREEAKARAEVVDILHEVTDSLKPDEIYHILTRRVARSLRLSKCAIVSAQPGERFGVLVAAYENPMLRNLEIQLMRYPEIRKALEAQAAVVVEDVQTDPLYAEVRRQWERDGITVPTRSAIAIPFFLKGELAGVFFLRTTHDDPVLTATDAEFAETVIKAAVSAIERAYDLEAAQTDRERFQFLANTDPLTGCLNRRAMLDRLEAELERAHRYELELTLLMIDLDWFKEINDTRGHLVGDTVLRQLGEVLRREARSVDIVARFGGEEFTLVLPETGTKGGRAFAERIRMQVEAHDFAEEGEPLHATVSVGVATYNGADPDVTVEAMIAVADAGLYRAKREGRNLVRCQ